MRKYSGVDWKTVGAILLGSVGAMGVSRFIDEMISWLKENRIKGKSKEYFQEMLKAHPALEKQDPKVVAQYWASLYHFAPHMAADPLASGAFIRQSIDRGYPELYGGPPIDTYGTLSSINKSVADSKEGKTRFTDAATTAVGKVMGLGLADMSGYGSDRNQSQGPDSDPYDTREL